MHKEKKDKNFVKKPVYPGGPKALRAFIAQHLKYPEAALETKTQGTVSLKYTIDHKGNVTGTDVISGLGHGCDEEAQRVVRMLKFSVPKTRGMKVLFHKDIHVHFRLPKHKPAPPAPPVQYSYTSIQKQAVPAKRGYEYTITLSKKRTS
jgi:TonB family protein